MVKKSKKSYLKKSKLKASDFFQPSYDNFSPNVHLHKLVEDAEFELTGLGRIEFCCHGCGHSLLISYTPETKSKILDEKIVFTEKHRKCDNFGFEFWCPCIRSHTELLDLTKTEEKNSLTYSLGEVITSTKDKIKADSA